MSQTDLTTNPPRGFMIPSSMADFVMGLFGWGHTGSIPDIKKFVVIAAPHTSNWDFVFAMLTASSVRVPISWMGKKELFRPPFGGLMRGLGGVSIDRSRKMNVVEQAVEAYENHDELYITITPEATRRYTEGWKSGFYHIARGAGVPILPIAIDYQQKRMHFGQIFEPSDDVDADIEALRPFFEEYGHAKYPENAAPIRVRPRKRSG